MADICHSIHITDDDLEDVTEVKKEKPTFITYYRHPLKGTMKVDTFEKACELAMIAKKKNDQRWEMWENLAWELPGAPTVTT